MLKVALPLLLFPSMAFAQDLEAFMSDYNAAVESGDTATAIAMFEPKTGSFIDKNRKWMYEEVCIEIDSILFHEERDNEAFIYVQSGDSTYFPLVLTNVNDAYKIVLPHYSAHYDIVFIRNGEALYTEEHEGMLHILESKQSDGICAVRFLDPEAHKSSLASDKKLSRKQINALLEMENPAIVLLTGKSLRDIANNYMEEDPEGLGGEILHSSISYIQDSTKAAAINFVAKTEEGNLIYFKVDL